MQSIIVNSFGGPEAFEVADSVRPEPGPDAVLVQVAISGVNYLDVNQRNGATPLKAPFIAGVEGVGLIVEVGSAVTDLAVGQRVGWLTGGQGSFADYTAVAAANTVPIPDDITDETAAALLMQGITAQYLATDAYAIKPGDTVLVHAAAGGVGQLLTQIAKLRGAMVIATASTAGKADVAREAGADHVLLYDGFADNVRALTDGSGVAAVYDGVGATTFDGSLASLAVRGTLVLFGASSGPVPPFEIPRLVAGGSLYLTRPGIVHYTRTSEELRGRAKEVFAWSRGGQLRVDIGGNYPLTEVRTAFEALESRRTTGKLLLVH